jgi:hypothetical protein
MTLKESIKKVLSEETLKDSLTDIIKTDGIERAAKTVGGLTRLAKILELDLDDVDTQEMLVKNFIYHTKFDQIDVSFIDVRSSAASGGKILTINLKTDDTASNVTSWYVNEICDYLNIKKELFPFKVRPAWHPVFALSGCKIFLDAKIIDGEETMDGEIDEYSRTLKNARRQGGGLRFPKSAVKANPMRFRPYNR